MIGKLVACEPAVQHAPLFTESLEHDKEHNLKIVKGDYNAKNDHIQFKQTTTQLVD